MTVDEAEKLASEVIAASSCCHSIPLARFVLAVLPVVRVADRWVKRLMDAPCYTALDPNERALIEAIDTLRAAMEGK